MRFKITQLELACFTLKKNQTKRRKYLLKMANKYLTKKPEIAYYLTMGTVPLSLQYTLPETNTELTFNLWEY